MLAKPTLRHAPMALDAGGELGNLVPATGWNAANVRVAGPAAYISPPGVGMVDMLVGTGLGDGAGRCPVTRPGSREASGDVVVPAACDQASTEGLVRHRRGSGEMTRTPLRSRARILFSDKTPPHARTGPNRNKT